MDNINLKGKLTLEQKNTDIAKMPVCVREERRTTSLWLMHCPIEEIDSLVALFKKYPIYLSQQVAPANFVDSQIVLNTDNSIFGPPSVYFEIVTLAEEEVDEPSQD